MTEDTKPGDLPTEDNAVLGTVTGEPTEAYPKWMFSASGEHRQVADADAEKSLKADAKKDGVKWYNSPSEIPGYVAPVGAPLPMTGAQVQPMENLPEGHTYHDRVAAQARSVGLDPDTMPVKTLEYLLWAIRMKASS